MKGLFHRWRQRNTVTSDEERETARRVVAHQREMAESLSMRLEEHEKQNNFSLRWERALKGNQ